MASRLALRARAPKAMPLVNIMGEALAELGQPTVSPSFLQQLAAASDKTVKGWLLVLAELGLVKQVTTQKWRLTLLGCWMADRNPEWLRLSEEETRSESEILSRVIGKSRNSSGFSQIEKPGATPTFEVDTVSLRLNPGMVPGYFQKPGDSDFSPYVCMSVNKESLINTFIQTRDEADRLAGLMVERVETVRRDIGCKVIAARLESGSTPDELERDILGHAALANGAVTITNKAGYLVRQIKQGRRAGAQEREHLARGQPSEPYAGYLDDEQPANTDLQRFDKLSERLGATQ